MNMTMACRFAAVAIRPDIVMSGNGNAVARHATYQTINPIDGQPVCLQTYFKPLQLA
jgi:hypothetical protein